MWVGLVGNCPGQGFQSGVYHFGHQHDDDANDQQAPFGQVNIQDARREDNRRGDEKVGEETALAANALPEPTKGIVELLAPGPIRPTRC